MVEIKAGYIPSVRTPTDYIKGVNSPLLNGAFVMDWRTVRPALCLQSKNGLETNGCVSWTAVQDCEELLTSLLGQMPKSHWDFLINNGYIINGKVVCSKVFIWNLSSSKPQGNDFPHVANAIHQNGLIPDSMMPFNPPQGILWQDYFNLCTPTPEQLAMGQKFKVLFDIGYHYLQDQNFKQHLLDGPIQCAIPLCAGYSTDTPVMGCNQQEQHSVLIDYVDDLNQKEIVDHYVPDVKLLSSNYPIPDSMQYVVTIKKSMPNQAKVVKSKSSPTVYISYPVPSMQFLAERASLEGITYDPTNIPNSDTL